MNASLVARGGLGRLAACRTEARTVLSQVYATSPLRLLLPDNHGHAAWVVPSTFGGGFVDGDAQRLEVDVAPGATLFLGAQAQGKAYRGRSRQELVVRVADGATFVSVPDVLACFEGASHDASTRVDLDATGSCVLVDGFTAGRTARGERWAFHRYTQRTEVRRAGVLVARDHLRLVGDVAARVGPFAAFANVFLIGPCVAPLLAAATAPRRPERDLVVSPSRLDDGALVRLAATSTEALARAVRAVLEGLPALLGDDPFARKW